ncbi:MAG: type II secretion system GspH family protein [Planctomycetaceae bacterium]|jgi:prepilin-type N-terminal cleavage/methylation domain-containing protein|nr:type II secretion system GspH family protein [Planctomycetaceae bacterium]
MIPTENITENSLQTPNKFNNFGMTLIELLIVLGILAALAGMTLTLVSEMDSSNRQNITKSKLDQLESIITGNNNQTSQFINDTGRLPVKIDGDGKELSELWNKEIFENTENITVNYNSSIENDLPITIPVTLNVGWKGPYINIPTTGKLYDGFGNNFWFAKDKNDLDDDTLWNTLNSNLTDTDNTAPISIIKFGSLGEDNIADNSNPDKKTNWQNIDDKREIKYRNLFATLHVKILLRDATTDQITWLPPTQTNGYKKYAAANSLYQDAIVMPPDSQFDPTTTQPTDMFITLPSASITTQTNIWSRYKTIVTTQTNVTEGTSQIYNLRWLPYSHKLNRLRVAVFSPYVAKNNETNHVKTNHVRITTAKYDYSGAMTTWEFDDKLYDKLSNGNSFTDFATIDDPDSDDDNSDSTNNNQTSINEVTFKNITPGIRKIFAYGYVANDSEPSPSNFQYSTIQTIELKPGENFITIYLSENEN